MQPDTPGDYVIATGTAHLLESFVELVFECLGMRWRDRVDIDSSLFRPSDIAISAGDPSKAERVLGWKPQTSFKELVTRLVCAEQQHTR